MAVLKPFSTVFLILVLHVCQPADFQTEKPHGRQLYNAPIPIEAVACSRHGDMLAIASGGGVRLWNVGDVRERFWFENDGLASIGGICFSDSAKMIAIVGAKGLVELWEVATGKRRSVLVGQDETLLACCWSKDGSQLVTGGLNGVIVVWDVLKNAKKWNLKGHTKDVFALCNGNRAGLVVSSAADQCIKAWDTSKGSELWSFRLDSSAVSLALSQDEKHLGYGCVNGDVEVKTLADMKSIAKLKAHQLPVTKVAWSPDGKLFGTGSLDRSVKLWETTSFQLVGKLNLPDKVLDIAFSSSGKTLVVATNDGAVLLFDVFR